MNGPNSLSIARVFLSFLFFGFINASSKWCALVATVIFFICMLTDVLDGYWARKKSLITVFGAFIDPVADKIVLTVALIAFLQKSYISSWSVVLLLTREFSVMALRFIALSETGKVISASSWGKIKTILQFITLFVILLFHNQFVFEREWVSASTCFLIIDGLMGITLFITLFSGAQYMYFNRACFGKSQ